MNSDDKIKQLQEQIKEEQEKQRKNIKRKFPGWEGPGPRLPGESRVISAKRRIQKAVGMKEYFGTLQAIKAESIKDLEQKDVGLSALAKVVENSDSISSEARLCRWHNAGSCTKGFNHLETQNTSVARIHLCSICTEVLNIGAFHKAINCELLRALDNSEQQQQSYTSSPKSSVQYLAKIIAPPQPPPRTKSSLET
jgi:hypothetical protein